MNASFIVSAVRTPTGKAPKGSLSTTRPDELAATSIREVLNRANEIAPDEIDDVILGCAMPEAEQGLNVARIASLRAGLPVESSAVTVNRFCSSGLQAIAFAAERIICGSANIIIAGGTVSMSLIPMGGNKITPNPSLIKEYPDVYLNTGLVAENHAVQSNISREEQDQFALQSHKKAIAAIDLGYFEDETVPINIRVASKNNRAQNTPIVEEQIIRADEGPRSDTSLEALAALRPVFRSGGTVTAGNSSQTSDGAAALLVMSETQVRSKGVIPMARFVTFTTAGVKPELFGLGPVPAMKKALKISGLTMNDIDLVEFNEAFAAQILTCLKEMPIDPDKLNVNGGAIALGHPLGCTGAKLTTSLLYELKRRNGRYGMVTMCVGGGMGAAGIFERL